ncbi:ribonuclease HI family protein [Flexistipes sp.]|uniref:ribonuclease HI family protein n=1 Tax=Flexistipes sp. TaxID=3088135 RepID=UPI002E1CFE2C|nr:ribonuclease HI family protein [Flexistipes sp.]
MYKVFSDGACKGNPGPAGIGFVIYDDDGEKVYECSTYIGEGTNNIAEYTAVLEAIKVIKQRLSEDTANGNLTGKNEKVIFHLDSELVVRQLNGIYKVKDPTLKKIFFKILEELKGMEYEVVHVPRDLNKVADRLSKRALNVINSAY